MLAMDASARQVTGHGGLHRRVEFAGRTDRQIALDLLRAGGDEEPSEQDVASLIDAYVRALSQKVMRHPYRAIAGVRGAVQAFRDAGAIVGLGTGNVREGARVKLMSAGLVDLFDLALGGYGDDATERDQLLEVGARRCDPGRRLPVVVVGDTPYDIRAAKAMGAISVAVSTGLYDAAVLGALDPALLVSSLEPDLPVRLERWLSASP